MIRSHESDVWMPSYCVSKFWKKKYGIVLAEINEIYCANHMFGSSPVPGTSPSLSRNLLATFKRYSGFDLVYQLVGDLEMPIWLPDEARSAEFAIHLFAKDVLQSIHSLFDCRWGTKCWCCAIFAIPSMTILIAEDEAQSAELVQAILLSYFFSCILLNLSAFPTSFLPIGGSIPSYNFLFSFPIYYSNLGYYQFYILFFAPACLEPFLI